MKPFVEKCEESLELMALGRNDRIHLRKEGVIIDDKKKQRLYSMTFSSVYPLYLAKVERKGKTEADLLAVIEWLTGYSEAGIQEQVSIASTFYDFFDNAPLMNLNAHLITGMICGYRIEEIEEPLHKKMRYLDKLVDEVAKGRPLEKIFRNS